MADAGIPASLTVRNVLADLLGRNVTVGPGEPPSVKDLTSTAVAVYADDYLHLHAVIGLDLPLAVYAAAALGLVQADHAAGGVEDGRFDPTLEENLSEVCNVLTTMFNREGVPHVKLDRVVPPGETAPNDAAACLLALGRRLDLTVDVPRYGAGRFWLSMAL